MSAIVEKVKGFFKRFVWLIVAVILLAASGAGGWYGWKAWQFRQSPQYAFEQITQAIATGQSAVLANKVDFRALCADLATQIYALRPQTPQLGNSPDSSIFLLSGEIQRQLLANLTAKPEEGKAPEKIDPYAPVAPLPPDFFHQLTKGLELRPGDAHYALLHAPIKHPRADKEGNLLLMLENTRDGWRITRIANTRDLVQYFLDTEATVELQRDKALEERNQLEKRRMNAQLGITACTASTHTLSDKRTGMLLLVVTGFNKGQDGIHNMNLSVTVSAGGQNSTHSINMAQNLPPGEHFTYTKRVEFEAQDPEFLRLSQAGMLTCTASPVAMTLTRGGVLHLREKRHVPPAQPAPAKK